MIVTTKDKIVETTRVVKSSECIVVQCFGIWLTLKFMIGLLNQWIFLLSGSYLLPHQCFNNTHPLHCFNAGVVQLWAEKEV